MVAATEIGWKALAVLAKTGDEPRVLARLATSVYLAVEREIVWLGPPGSTLHPRAILAPLTFAAGAGDRIRIDPGRARVWRGPALRLDPRAAEALVAGSRWLHRCLASVGVPAGLAGLLHGAPAARCPSPRSIGSAQTDGSVAAPAGAADCLDHVLRRAAAGAAALVRACATDDPAAAERAAVALVGLGPGLTPSGDDYVGGAYFARRLLALATGENVGGWTASADAVLARARRATHPVSAALLADLVGGDGHAPLHDLVSALVEHAPPEVVLDAARRLTAIGHTSGWDILAGVLGALEAGPA